MGGRKATYIVTGSGPWFSISAFMLQYTSHAGKGKRKLAIRAGNLFGRPVLAREDDLHRNGAEPRAESEPHRSIAPLGLVPEIHMRIVELPPRHGVMTRGPLCVVV